MFLVLKQSTISHHQHLIDILWQFCWKYTFKVQFIYKNNHDTVLVLPFGRSEMVFNIDFRDILALEPLPKFGFWKAFVSSKNWNLLFWLSLRNTNICQIYDISIVFHAFYMDKDAKVSIYQPFVGKLRTCSLTEMIDVCLLFQCWHYFWRNIFGNNKYFLIFWV